MQKALVNRLLSDSTLSGLIGTKLFPENVPQSIELPACYYMSDNNPPQYCDNGTAVIAGVFTVVAYARTKTGVMSIADAITARLSRYSGTLESEKIEFCQWSNSQDDYDEQNRVFIRECNFDVTYIKQL